MAVKNKADGSGGTLKRKKKIKLRFLIIIIAVAAVICAIWAMVTFGEYTSYKITLTDEQENTLVYSYYSYGTDMFKCASDAASLVDSSNTVKWNVSFDMTNPNVDICDESIVVYDKNGTSVLLCDADGECGSFNTQMPIISAETASQGTCAVLTDDGTNAEINYYDKDGSLISTIKTTMESDGYPMDMSLSDDGQLICVSYINTEDGESVTDLCIYSFGSSGQLVSDNKIGSFELSGNIVPEVEYMDDMTCVAFGTDQINVIRGAKSPEIISTIDLDDEVRSTFVSDNGFGYIMTGNENAGNEILTYNKNGKLKKEFYTDFNYTNIEQRNDMLLMYNRNEMCLYTTSGIRKFYGAMPGLIRQIQMFDKTSYAVATISNYNVITLG